MGSACRAMTRQRGRPLSSAISTGETVVLVRLQDLEQFAPRTIPAMRAAVETLRLR